MASPISLGAVATAFTLAGGGLTGIWTVYQYLSARRKQAQEATRAAVEAEHRLTTIESGLYHHDKTLQDHGTRLSQLEQK